MGDCNFKSDGYDDNLFKSAKRLHIIHYSVFKNHTINPQKMVPNKKSLKDGPWTELICFVPTIPLYNYTPGIFPHDRILGGTRTLPI